MVVAQNRGNQTHTKLQSLLWGTLGTPQNGIYDFCGLGRSLGWSMQLANQNGPIQLCRCSKDPSAQILPTLGPNKICKYYPCWAIWILIDPILRQKCRREECHFLRGSSMVLIKQPNMILTFWQTTSQLFVGSTWWANKSNFTEPVCEQVWVRCPRTFKYRMLENQAF